MNQLPTIDWSDIEDEHFAETVQSLKRDFPDEYVAVPMQNASSSAWVVFQPARHIDSPCARAVVTVSAEGNQASAYFDKAVAIDLAEALNVGRQSRLRRTPPLVHEPIGNDTLNRDGWIEAGAEGDCRYWRRWRLLVAVTGGCYTVYRLSGSKMTELPTQPKNMGELRAVNQLKDPTQ